GGPADVTVLLAAGATANTYYKYGSESGGPTPHWYEFDLAGGTGAVLNAGTLTLHLIDGQRGDADLAADGVIRDPGGPSSTIVTWINPNGGSTDTRAHPRPPRGAGSA